MIGMIFLSIFLIAAGLLMWLRPEWVWSIAERWKSADAEEPSDLYLWTVRARGIFCTVIGVVTLVGYFILGG